MTEIPKKESLTVEFKSDRKGYPDRELIEACVALANTEGGELYLGVEDNGEITGIITKHQDEIGLLAMLTNSIAPSIYINCEMQNIDNKYIMKIIVPKCSFVVSTKSGKLLRRRLKVDGEPENIPMYAYEIPNRLSSLGLLDFSSLPLYELTIDDFDENEITRLKKTILISGGDESLNNLDNEELFKALRLVITDKDKLVPTITGMLLIGKEEIIKKYIPSAKAIFQVLEGLNVKKNEEYTYPLLKTLSLLEENLNVWNKEYEIDDGLLRIKNNEFSKTSFREAIVNAFCHRDYSIMGSIRVCIDDDGLTISSPGGFVEGININNLLTVEPKGRNMCLADAFKRIGLAEKTGRGIDRIFLDSILYAKPWPDYSSSTSNNVSVFIQRYKPNFAFNKMIKTKEEINQKKFSFNTLLVLSCIYNENNITKEEISRITQISDNRLTLILNELLDNKLIKSVNKGKNVVYTTKDEKEIEYTDYNQSVINLANKSKDGISRLDVANSLNISKDQAYRLLNKMVKKNILVKVGNGRNTTYKLSKTSSY